MLRPFVALLLMVACAQAHATVQPFFAPAQPAGSIDVTLHPTEVVTANVPQTVTFGVPFPRGSITAAQLSTLRVLRGGVEIPAHVEQLTPWRHRVNPSLDGTSVRVALVQIQAAFPAPPATVAISVEWGGAARTLDVPTRLDPRSAWHPVTSGTFVAADNILEPNVYAVLPKGWLSQGLLKPSRSTPFVDAAPDTRDDPAANDAVATWPGFQEAERAMKNNFFTMINRDDPLVTTLVNYKTDREPWLYDRGATMFVLHFRSGGYNALREAVRATQFYADRLDGSGFFTVGGAGGDAKYAYNESMAYTYWLTGDVALQERIERVVNAHTGFPHSWNPARNFWTERHAAFKLLANVVAYEVSGGTTRRDAVGQILADYRTHQDGANGTIPANRVDGGLYHYGDEHDGDFVDDELGASSWMSALLSDAAVRAYATGEDAATAQFVARLAVFLRSTIVTADQLRPAIYGTLTPRYTVRFDGRDGFDFYYISEADNFTGDAADVEHSLEIAAQIAWGHWFVENAGAEESELAQSALALYGVYDLGVNHWIRPAGPMSGLAAYRVSPPRKWGWEHRTSDGLEFALTEGAADPPLFADGFE